MTKIAVRVWGEFACFARPEMKVERVSYPVPTPSAARGMLEAIYWEPQMCYLIDSILIVKRGRWISIRRNEVSKVINMNQAQKWMTGKAEPQPIEAGGGAADAAQRNMLALEDVAYVIVAEIRLTHLAQPPGDNLAKYQKQIRTRASRGKCAHRPGLGYREFAADFDWVENLEEIEPESPFEDDVGLMLYDVFDPSQRTEQRNVRPEPVFFHGRVQQNWLDCHPERVELIRPSERSN